MLLPFWPFVSVFRFEGTIKGGGELRRIEMGCVSPWDMEPKKSGSPLASRENRMQTNVAPSSHLFQAGQHDAERFPICAVPFLAPYFSNHPDLAGSWFPLEANPISMLGKARVRCGGKSAVTSWMLILRLENQLLASCAVYLHHPKFILTELRELAFCCSSAPHAVGVTGIPGWPPICRFDLRLLDGSEAWSGWC